MSQPSSHTTHKSPVSKISFWLRVGFLTSAILASSLIYISYHPSTLKPLIEAGLPLNSLSQVPLLGDSIRAAAAPQMDVQELHRLITSNATNFVLVDVRTSEEYHDVHIPGAISIPLPEIEQGNGISKLKALAPGHQIITYCTSGKRSNKALELLRNAGIQGSNINGGIRAWREQIDPSLPEV